MGEFNVNLVNKTKDILNLVISGFENGDQSIKLSAKEKADIKISEKPLSIHLDNKSKFVVYNRGLTNRNVKHKFKQDFEIDNKAKKVVFKKVYKERLSFLNKLLSLFKRN